MKQKELESQLKNKTTAERKSGEPNERNNERTIDRTTERMAERTTERTADRNAERATERSEERTAERNADRAADRTEEQATKETISDRNTVISDRNSALTNMTTKVNDIVNQAQNDAKVVREEQELRYIATLNKKIAGIKKEEEEAKRRLESVEFAHKLAANVETGSSNINVVHFSEQDGKEGFDSNLHKQLTEEGQFLHDNLMHDAPNGGSERSNQEKFSSTFKNKKSFKAEPLKQVKSMLKNTVPGTKSIRKSTSVKASASKTATNKVSSASRNVPSIAYYNFKPDINPYNNNNQVMTNFNANRYTLYHPKKAASTETETVHSNVPYIMAKKQLIKKLKKNLNIHLVPGEYTGFKKHHIFEFHPQHEVKGYDTNVVRGTSKSEISSKHYGVEKPLHGEVFKLFEDGVSADENTVVAEDNDTARKRENEIEEAKLFEKLNNTSSGDEESIGEKKSIVFKNRPSELSKKSDFSVIKEINKGPITVTVAVHHNKVHNNTPAITENDKEGLDIVDPFGFNRCQYSRNKRRRYCRQNVHPQIIRR